MRFREYPTQQATTIAFVLSGCVGGLGLFSIFYSSVRYGSSGTGTVLLLFGVIGIASAWYARVNGRSLGWGIERVEDTNAGATNDDASDDDPLQSMLAEEQRLRAERDADAVRSASRPAVDENGIATQLERLAAMHRAGELTDDEFAAAKGHVLRGAPSS